MDRSDAQRVAQEKMAQVRDLLKECMGLADTHQFLLHLDGIACEMSVDTYVPKGCTRELLDDWDPWHGVNDGVVEMAENFGQWMSSSQIGDC